MAEFKLERFKYNWKGAWVPNTAYKRDDVVSLNGKSFVCLITHTSATLFQTDLNNILPGSVPPQSQPRWVVMTDGRKYLGNWNQGSEYLRGNVVNFNGNLYTCIEDHISNNFADDAANWSIFTAASSFVGDWAQSRSYSYNDIVRYNGIVYKCISPHNSQSTLELDFNSWEEFYTNVEYVGDWEPLAEYRKHDIISYGGTLFRCTETHFATDHADPDMTRFIVELPGYQFDNSWNAETFYNQGDIVRYGGNLYVARQNSQVNDPNNTIYWTLIAEFFNFKGNYNIRADYNIGDLVYRGGYLLRAVRDISVDDIDPDITLSFNDYLDTDKWEILLKSANVRGKWELARTYLIGDVVYHRGSAYICAIENNSSLQNVPDEGGPSWNVFIDVGFTAGLTNNGDLLSYGKSRLDYLDDSTVGPSRVPVGNLGEVLSVSSQLEAFWRDVGSDMDVVHVGLHGFDEPGYGTSLTRPFRTVRHACEYVADHFDPLTPVKIAVSTGRYEEICPISIPAGCVIMGDELRSTTIVANSPLEVYQNDYTYFNEGIEYVENFIFDVISSTAIEPTVGNNEQQQFSENIGTLEESEGIAALKVQFRDYIEFRIASGNTNPIPIGTNVITTNQNRLNTSALIDLNREFIVAEIYARLRSNYPSITFDEHKVKSDYRSYLRATAKDLQHDNSNYYTLLSARRYANAVNGSQLEDVFYVRDTTGIRNATLTGLSGILNPPGVFELYQRPNTGAYVSLDPGWGPADERMWILRRSPYIQNVTTIGTACVGQKIDGALHNGGNKSCTSNDFTQVLSDGIGAWITNNGRVELVSVFTYYNQVGYLAENGGTIRATNGNNSYGKFGAIADGNDPNEVPQNVFVWNRNNQAQVKEAFAGGNDDRIFAFEYSHCGEQYTQASANIIGAGAQAEVIYEDFRDGALFEARLVNTQGSGTEGGTGYLLRQGNAQITVDASSSIILSTNDPTEPETLNEVLGMRIIIISGRGAGQYGYINNLNTSSKLCTVRRDSDDELGWDHIIPGTPLETSLDSTTRYRIEPRLTVNDPGFTATTANIPNQREVADIAFGGITEVYANIDLPESAEGITRGLELIGPARLTITRKGSQYIISFVNRGLGYVVGDTFTILGSDLGGISPDNDLTITVTDTTDDSSSSIISIEQSGVGRNGRYVAVAQPNFIIYSDDATEWAEASTSVIGNYKKVVAGNDTFVALIEDTDSVLFSSNGAVWEENTLPASQKWVDITYGNSRFVAIAENSSVAAYSLNGSTWTQTDLPTGDDSAGDQWKAVAYGAGKFVVITGSQTKDVATSTNGITWTRFDNVLPAGDYNWISLSYGNNRFLALDSSGKTAFSLDHGQTWIIGSVLPQDQLGDPMIWADMKFAQGVFFAVGSENNNATNLCATSEDGIRWSDRSLSSTQRWSAVTFSNINNIGKWTAIASAATIQGINNVLTGCQAKVRADILEGKFQTVKIWDPGSGYSDSNPLVITVTSDPFDTEVEFENRIGNGVISQPSFINRGSGYRSSTSTISISGNGFADIIFQDDFIVLSGVATIPGPGVQLRINGIEDEDTLNPDDLKLFTGIIVRDLGDDGSGNGTRLVSMTINPSLRNEYNLQHLTAVTLRERYSQCRITGHDFLDIGTGNFEQTNYPEIYSGGRFFTASPENEVDEQRGGRVFYTSTDQDGNFRTGELFGVNQATGIVTLSAQFFELDGLSELSLGGVRLGGSGTVVREFSTDQTFSQDSNNVIPTQRAIVGFLANRLSVGGEDLEANRIIAGSIGIGTNNNTITNVGGNYLNFTVPVRIASGLDFNGNPSSIQGTIVSQMLFLRKDTDTIQ